LYRGFWGGILIPDFTDVSLEVSFRPQAFSRENKEIPAPPPNGLMIDEWRLMIGIYLLYENWSIETFKREGLKTWAGADARLLP